MDSDYEEFWSALPDKAVHPHRVSMLEALWSIGEPLSALDTVDVLEGAVDMWEAAHHFSALEALGVVEPVAVKSRKGQTRDGDFDVPYQLKRE